VKFDISNKSVINHVIVLFLVVGHIKLNVPNYRNDVSIAPRHPDFALLGALLGRRSSPNNLQQNANMDRIT